LVYFIPYWDFLFSSSKGKYLIFSLLLFFIASGTILTVYKANNKTMEEMKKSDLTFYKVLIGVIYVLLALLVVVAFFL